MKFLAAAIPTLLVTSALSACAIDGEALTEDPIGEPTEAAALDSSPASPEAKEVLLDGRAAAAAEAKLRGEIGAQGIASSWFSGTVAAGSSQSWTWNNSGTTTVFEVGLTPTGASTAAPCRFSVTRRAYVQKHGGEREFHFTIKNNSTIACGATIQLGYKVASSTIAAGGLAPGSSTTRTWNNANPTTASYMVGVNPTGATSGDDCEMEVTRVWYALMPGGERELRYNVKNVGDIACQANILLARATASATTWNTLTIADGAAKTWSHGPANPTDRIYVPALAADTVVYGSPCVLEVESDEYRQSINSDGDADRFYRPTVRNIGTINCSGKFLLNYID